EPGPYLVLGGRLPFGPADDVLGELGGDDHHAVLVSHEVVAGADPHAAADDRLAEADGVQTAERVRRVCPSGPHTELVAADAGHVPAVTVDDHADAAACQRPGGDELTPEGAGHRWGCHDEDLAGPQCVDRGELHLVRLLRDPVDGDDLERG